MNSRLASVRVWSGPDRVDRAVQLLEDEWQRHGDVHLESFWAEQNRTGAVGSVDELGGCWPSSSKLTCGAVLTRGKRPTAAGYLERFPELAPPIAGS